MTISAKLLIVAGCLALPIAASAQSTENAETTEAEPTESNSTENAADGNGEGTTAPAQENYPTEPAQQQPAPTDIVYEVHGDWQVRCAADDPKNCFLYQLGRDAGDNPIAEFNLVQLRNEGKAVAGVTIVTPLGTDLRKGLQWSIDSAKPRPYPYSWCAQVGCFARFGMTVEQVAAMKRGAAGKLSLASIQNPERVVDLKISLSGFTAAYDTLTEVLNQKAE